MRPVLPRPSVLSIELLIVFEVSVEAGAVQKLDGCCTLLHVELEVSFVLRVFGSALSGQRPSGGIPHQTEPVTITLDELAFVLVPGRQLKLSFAVSAFIASHPAEPRAVTVPIEGACEAARPSLCVFKSLELIE